MHNLINNFLKVKMWLVIMLSLINFIIIPHAFFLVVICENYELGSEILPTKDGYYLDGLNEVSPGNGYVFFTIYSILFESWKAKLTLIHKTLSNPLFSFHRSSKKSSFHFLSRLEYILFRLYFTSFYINFIRI